MKLRQKIEDFRVEEITKFNLLKDGKFRLYLLEKRGLESFSLIQYLSRLNHIPSKAFGIAGLKDRHAITRQYFTIPSRYEIKTLKEKNFDIKFLGFVNKGIRLGDLLWNRFEIVVRNIKKSDLDGVYEKAESAKTIGVPNYFGEQRFGSVLARKFIGKYVVQGNYEEAVKLYLTRYTKHEDKGLKNERKLIYKEWGKLTKLDIQYSPLSSIIQVYKKTKSWFEAYMKIPSYLRKIYLSAYQSYLWNECVKEILKRTTKDLYSVEYKVGSLLFYKKIDKLPEKFPLVNYNTRFSPFEKEICDKILLEEDIKIKDFNLKTKEMFPIGRRNIILKPTNFKISKPYIDELNKKKRKNNYKVLLSFDLSKGSYATVIIQSLFSG